MLSNTSRLQQGNPEIREKKLALRGGLRMYKRHTGQVSMLETPEMFGSLPLDPNNDWIKLIRLLYQRHYRCFYQK